jgi:hypothetical protein
MTEPYTAEIFPSVASNTFGSTSATVATTTSFAALSGHTGYVSGFEVSATGGSGALSPITIGPFDVFGSTATTSITYYGITAGGAPFIVNFNTPLAGVGVNSAITLTTTANTTATTVVSAITGFYQ